MVQKKVWTECPNPTAEKMAAMIRISAKQCFHTSSQIQPPTVPKHESRNQPDIAIAKASCATRMYRQESPRASQRVNVATLKATREFMVRRTANALNPDPISMGTACPKVAVVTWELDPVPRMPRIFDRREKRETWKRDEV